MFSILEPTKRKSEDQKSVIKPKYPAFVRAGTMGSTPDSNSQQSPASNESSTKSIVTLDGGSLQPNKSNSLPVDHSLGTINDTQTSSSNSQNQSKSPNQGVIMNTESRNCNSYVGGSINNKTIHLDVPMPALSPEYQCVYAKVSKYSLNSTNDSLIIVVVGSNQV